MNLPMSDQKIKMAALVMEAHEGGRRGAKRVDW